MTQENYIVDAQLPLELDFKSLKAEGFAYIQQHSSTEWTNLNPSDPGVTIFEQLCYAFTELGYCGNFSMKDILTQKNGKLTVENQFFLPQNILTTSPITLEDYIKYIIDRVESVKNVVITPVSTIFPCANGIYKVYLTLHPSDDETTEDAAKTETFSQLNTCRNVGDLFLMPEILSPKKYTINGNIQLKSGYDLHSILPEMIQTIANYIFPDVVQTGYDKLKLEGKKTNEIFNGATLKNGWIPSESMQPKKDSIHAFEITQLILEIEGVQSIAGISFKYNDKEATNTAICLPSEILTFDFSSSFLTNKKPASFSVNMQGKQLNTSINASLIDELANMQQTNVQVNEVAAVQMAPVLPEGKYRDITSYYSIQNTFPEIYAVGLNATNSNTPDYQVAQSRQLKGYLSLFDQMLSNQFAQLANLDKLFSFKNAAIGNPADFEHYNNIKTAAEKANPAYPAPFEVFSPTYFYQSLYKSVPNIEPLLRNNDIFDFGPVSESDDSLKHKSWLAYQDDPYNSYMYGLLTFSEDDTVNLQRRNDLLDHLLARHGESPLVIDSICYGTAYSGDILKDRVIIKSVYLQNLALLSYNNTKAYNYISAQKLQPEVLTLTVELIDELTQNNTLNVPEKNAKNLSKDAYKEALELYKAKKELQNILRHSYETNGIFDTNRFDASQKITTQDCNNYSTFELEISMLLTLEPFYINFIQEASSSEALTTEKLLKIYVAFWLITQRKGTISIETNLLANSASFTIYMAKKVNDTFVYYSYKTSLNYTDSVVLADAFCTMPACIAAIILSDETAWTEVLEPSTEVTNYAVSIGETSYKWNMIASWNDTTKTSINNPVFSDTLLTFFPDFIPEVNTDEWQNRLSFYKESKLPLHIAQHTQYLSAENFAKLIPLYISWYNAHIYATPKMFETAEDAAAKQEQQIITNSGNLLAYLKTIYTKTDA
ncbi:hypothetical protein U8527_02540 [Kordia algicida OT-1]|uniref:Uncharacterized protein n=1 Tax=Kordia algicida OT-1 TaxID=391587 RepID=A9DNH0_9FLAO|nr:hypothetical protein [Kordia algicida]EDP97189.1 hypothetical protein KAOT1_18542 [Kordia algicida OT-1]